MTRRVFAIEKPDGRCRNRSISNGGAAVGGGEGLLEQSLLPVKGGEFG
jgi:hypothetical protein